jgi:phosphoglycolate phosphatase
VTDYEAVVYDLDGTLVRLDVDWGKAHRDVLDTLRANEIPVGDDDLWDVLERATAAGFRSLVEETLAEHEREGARTSERLSAADDLPRPVPVGVCSLNAESACRLALDRHGLADAVDAVVGRDTLDTYKPDPEPLLETIDALGAQPAQTLFIGDTDRDAVTAERAGVPFRRV